MDDWKITGSGRNYIRMQKKVREYKVSTRYYVVLNDLVIFDSGVFSYEQFKLLRSNYIDNKVPAKKEHFRRTIKLVLDHCDEFEWKVR
jgi:hypothetical protein